MIRKAIINGLLFGLIITIAGYTYSECQFWFILAGLTGITLNLTL